MVKNGLNKPMLKNRFELISKNLRLAKFIPNLAGQDPWIPIRGFIEAFNNNQVNLVIPGHECMSPWDGKESKWSADGMPHVTNFFRKPKGIGAELKSTADGESDAILRLEVQEGKEAMQSKEYANLYTSHTAITLRLVKPWLGSKRTVIGDSAFASFSTCVSLLSMGLFFIGIVKTASAKFPKAFLNAWEATKPTRGSTMFLSTIAMINNISHKILAVGWKCKMVKCFFRRLAIV